MPQSRFAGVPPAQILLGIGALIGVVGFYAGWASHSTHGVAAIPVVPSEPGPASANGAMPSTTPSARTGGWRGEASGPTEVRARAERLSELAHNRPLDALREALADPNLVVRAMLRDAVLRSWSGTSPEAAAHWVLQLAPAERSHAMAAVFAGAVQQPDKAVEVGREMCAASPSDADIYGDLLIRALDEGGYYGNAVQFACGANAGEQSRWCNTVFAEWAAFQPDRAAAAVASIVDEQARAAAFAGLVSGWCDADPAGLADFAISLPDGENRDDALAQALSRWAISDPAAVLAWVNRQPASLGCDAALNTIASAPDIVANRPDVAIQCAVTIGSPDVRRSLLTMLAQSWAERDRTRALTFVASLTTLSHDDHAALMAGLNAQDLP